MKRSDKPTWRFVESPIDLRMSDIGSDISEAILARSIVKPDVRFQLSVAWTFTGYKDQKREIAGFYRADGVSLDIIISATLQGPYDIETAINDVKETLNQEFMSDDSLETGEILKFGKTDKFDFENAHVGSFPWALSSNSQGRVLLFVGNETRIEFFTYVEPDNLATVPGTFLSNVENEILSGLRVP